MVVEPEETSVVPRGYSYFDVGEQAAIAVPDPNGIRSGCRDAIALWRIPGCYHRTIVFECLYSLASCNVPDGGCAIPRRRDETSRVGREIDSVDESS